MSVSDEAIEDAILGMVAARGAGKTICPSEAARALGGNKPDGWSPLMPRVRRIAVRLMKDGRVAIRRKGRIVDPDDFRGIYRIGEAEGDGNNAPVRPDAQ